MERHQKWTRVEPGTIIPAGQPYRVEYNDNWPNKAFEAIKKVDEVASSAFGARATFFVDSSWKPPLVLPTEPTWGIAVYDTPGTVAEVGRWYLLGDMLHGRCDWFADRVLDFIPLTDEQVARIEAAS